MTIVSFAALSDTGCIRSHNEDRWFADPDQQIYVVSDGMGGQAGGAVASRIVVEILPGRLQPVLSNVNDLREPTVTERIIVVRHKNPTDSIWRIWCRRTAPLCAPLLCAGIGGRRHDSLSDTRATIIAAKGHRD